MSYGFELDDSHAVIWIVYQHDRFRMNCCIDRLPMLFWAKYWFIREFPFCNLNERQMFNSDFDMFLSANQERIRELALEIDAKRRDEYAKLVCEIKSHLRFEKERSKLE